MPDTIPFKVVGLTFVDTIDAGGLIVTQLKSDKEVYLATVREPDNKHDRNAISVRYAGYNFGYIPRELAEKLAPLIDSEELRIKVKVRRCGWMQDLASYFCHCDLILADNE